MKIMASILVCGLLMTSPAFARVATITLTARDGGVHLSFLSKPVTRAEMKGLLEKLAALDKDQQVHVVVDEKVPAAALVDLLKDIQRAGLHDLVLAGPAEEGGRRGMNQITIDSTKRTFAADVGGTQFESGFHEPPAAVQEPR